MIPEVDFDRCTYWEVVRRLVVQGQLVETEYGDHRFYLRRLRGWKDRD
jgi:hypothetical protein